jgi:drug/metabolite transporter (DMT)-like permease
MIALVFVTMLAMATILLRPRGLKPWIAIAGLVVGVGALVLPPGGRQFREALTTWRAIGGPSWCVLAMFFCTAWSVLEWRRRAGSEPEGPRDEAT